MGLLRGTKLALVGVVGAAIAWWYEVGETLRRYEVVETALGLPMVRNLVAEHGVVLDWSVGVFAGVVVADLYGYLGRRTDGRNVRAGSTLGVGKGVTAVAAGVVALAFDDRIFAEVARHAPEIATFVETYLGGTAVFCFALGIWVGVLVGEAVRL